MSTATFDSFTLRPLRAQLSVPTTLFKKKFYVVITIGQSNFKTQIDGNGGKHPHWRDQFVVKENNKHLPISVKIYRKNLILGDKLQAEALLLLEQIYPSAEPSIKTVELFNNKTRIGEIVFEVQAIPNSQSTTNSLEDKKQPEECNSFREHLSLPSEIDDREVQEAKSRKEELLEMKLSQLYDRIRDQSHISSRGDDLTRRSVNQAHRNLQPSRVKRAVNAKDVHSQATENKSSEFSLCSMESLFDRSSKQMNITNSSNFDGPSYMKPTVRSIVNRGSEAVHRKLPPILKA